MKKGPFLYRMIRGAVGKRFVVKHYKGGKVVVTRFPDMSGIVPSKKQRARRDLFREAVVYAKWMIEDRERKKAFRKKLPRKKRGKVYQAAIRLYMRMQGDKGWLRKQLAVRGVMGETSNVKGYEQMGPWKVMWQKREDVVNMLEREWDGGCFVALRI
jgi:hypothetical protein